MNVAVRDAFPQSSRAARHADSLEFPVICGKRGSGLEMAFPLLIRWSAPNGTHLVALWKRFPCWGRDSLPFSFVCGSLLRMKRVPAAHQDWK